MYNLLTYHSLPQLTAILLEKPTTPHFEAQYAVFPGTLIRPNHKSTNNINKLSHGKLLYIMLFLRANIEFRFTADNFIFAKSTLILTDVFETYERSPVQEVQCLNHTPLTHPDGGSKVSDKILTFK